MGDFRLLKAFEHPETCARTSILALKTAPMPLGDVYGRMYTMKPS